MIRASVVVPTYRRPDLLRRCLAALREQDFPAEEYEVIVADDAASADTEELVRGYPTEGGPAIRYVGVSGTHGPAAARNAGWHTAAGAIIAFTDDDCVPDPGWLRAGIAEFTDDVAAAWGQLRMPLPPEPTDYERDAAGLATAEFVTANCFCRKRVLKQLGGFDEQFTAAWREDSDLFFRLLEAGQRVAHAPAAVVVHPIRPAAWGVSLKQQRKSIFNALLYKKHPRLYRRKIQTGPPWQYYAAVAAVVVALVAAAGGRPGICAAALGVWLLVTLRFCLRRLRSTSRAPRHVAEMALTSALIPPLAIYWRLRGAVRYRVLFL